MLRLLIDWTSNKLASALSWFKEMASAFGFGQSKNFAEDGEVRPQNPKGAPFPSNLTTPRSRSEKHRAKIELEAKTDKFQTSQSKLQGTSQNLDVEIATRYPLIQSNFNGRRDEFYFVPGHAKVKLVPFVRIPSHAPASEKLESKTCAGILKASPSCARWLSKPHEEHRKKLHSEMKLWKRRYGFFSAFVLVDESDECTPDDSSTKLCPMTSNIVTNVQETLAELFGDAFLVDETIMFQDGKRTRTIYVAPSMKREKNQRDDPNQDDVEFTERERESEKPAQQCAPAKSTKDEDQYLVLEDKLLRRQDYNRKRKQGKANRKRLRQPECCVPVTKREISIMGVKSEPISMRCARNKNSQGHCRKGNRADDVDEFLVDKKSEAKFRGFNVDEYDVELKPSKRTKRNEASFRRSHKRQKVSSS